MVAFKEKHKIIRNIQYYGRQRSDKVENKINKRIEGYR